MEHWVDMDGNEQVRDVAMPEDFQPVNPSGVAGRA